MPRCPIGPAAAAFRRAFFPAATRREWNDWRWQMRQRLQTLPALARVLQLSDDEAAALRQPDRPFPVSLTPYYASLLDRTNPADPLRRTMLPSTAEFRVSPGELRDPLAEDSHSPVPGLVHRYPDRALFLLTDICPVYCRYCTRSRLVGGHAGFRNDQTRWQRALDYLAATPAVRDVLISGGDPLIYADDKLGWLLARLRAIPHVEMIRLGTKVPMVLPQRVTPALARLLRRYHPLYLSLHVIHPRELTPESALACTRLADAGLPLGSQTVLLRGVNDNLETVRALMHGLLRVRVRPYYLLQCDPIAGSAQFRTPVRTGVDLIAGLRGHTTGYAVPHFIIDAPGGGGKVSLDPEYVVGREGDDLLVRTYLGQTYRYPDPQ